MSVRWSSEEDAEVTSRLEREKRIALVDSVIGPEGIL